MVSWHKGDVIMNIFEKAQNFVYRNARPLDLALWQYHFEGGAAENVLKALSAYQNPDGGFGHALEPDNFTPVSSPMQTWAATEIIDELAPSDSKNKLVKGILRYLESGNCFDNEKMQWLNTIPENNDYPCAIWWKYGENGSDFRYNPTAALAGFALKYADKNSCLYKLSKDIAVRGIEWFNENVPFDEMHITNCFIRLYEYLKSSEEKITDMSAFENVLKRQVNNSICRDTEKWKNEYVPLPSVFITSKDSIFYPDNSELIRRECEHIKSIQLKDGSFPVNWIWCNDYKEYELSVNWWKSKFCISNMLFLREFDAVNVSENL